MTGQAKMMDIRNERVKCNGPGDLRIPEMKT